MDQGILSFMGKDRLVSFCLSTSIECIMEHRILRTKRAILGLGGHCMPAYTLDIHDTLV